MHNLEKVVSKYNQKVLITLYKTADDNNQFCNYRLKIKCPANGICLTNKAIYKATIDYKNKKMMYIGSTGKQFKSRLY